MSGKLPQVEFKDRNSAEQLRSNTSTSASISKTDEGLFVLAKVSDTQISMLVDTGSNVTIIRKSLTDSWPTSVRQCITPVNMTLVTATGDSVPFLGKISVDIELGEQKLKQDVLLADISNDGILGVDFLNAHHCDINMSKKCIKINGQKVHCYARDKNSLSSCCRIAVTEDVTIPPEVEMIVPGKPIDMIKETIGLVEPNNLFVEKSGLLVAKALVDLDKGRVPIRIINLSKEPCTVYRDTVAATYESVDIPDVKRVEYVSVNKVEQTTELPEHMKEMFNKSTTNLTPEQIEKLKELLRKHKAIFPESSSELGCTHLVEHTIDTGQSKPIRQYPYRIPLARRLAAEAEIKDMAERGLIEHSTSPWSSPIIMVSKPDGTIRFCCDFRKLNDCTIKDSQPLPRIDDTLDALSGSAWFSTLDLKSGFWQVGVAKKDRPKTAFSIQGSGLWQFTVMPFGLCNAPATFERLMERVLSGLTWKTCLVYLDDIITFSKTFEEHIDRLDQVFKRIAEANLKLNQSKCIYLQREVSFLGHIISEHGVSTDPKKIETVKNWPTPRKVKDVRSFLGLCSYYRKFVQGFSTIASPLHKLTEKKEEFRWTKECEVAFETLKKLLTITPVLAYPTANDNFVLDVDASNTGLGAVLSQTQNGEEKVISYYSKCFSKQERRYCVTRRELLGVVSSIKHFHNYLYGRHFLVRSDHGALRWLMNFKKPEAQMARWLETLATYDFEIQHRAGRIHCNADSLSRRPCVSENCSYCERAEIRYSEEKTDKPQDVLKETTTQTTNSKVESCKDSGIMSAQSIECPLDGTSKSISPGLGLFPCESDYTPVAHEDLENGLPDVFTCQDIHTGNDTIDSHTTEGIQNESLGTHEKSNVLPVASMKRTRALVRTCEDIGNAGTSKPMNIGRLDNENLIQIQEKDPILDILRCWKRENKKPTWSDVAGKSIELKYYWNRLDSLILKDDMLCRRWESDDGREIQFHVVIPRTLVSFVLKELHDSVTGGHLGITKTLSRVKRRFFWHGMRNDIEQWCKKCDVCASRKRPAKQPKSAMSQYNVGAPLERVAMDIVGPLPRSNSGNKYILMISDYFTKWMMAIPVRNQEAETIAKKFVERFVSVFGIPRQIHTDQGTNFESNLFKEMCRILGSEKTRTTPMRPQSDGLVERANRTIQNMLASFVNTQQKDWDQYLTILTMAYNTAKQESTGYPPCVLMFGRDLTMPIDLMMGSPETDDVCVTDYGYDLKQKLLTIYDLARQHMTKASDIQKKQYDHKIYQHIYNPGDLVWYYSPQCKPSISPKLARPWLGPFTVIKRLNDLVYRIKLNAKSKPKVVHHDRLKPYTGSHTSWYKPVPEKEEIEM